MIEKIEAGQTVSLIVQAVNHGSQGVASEPVIVEVLAAKAAAAPAPQAAAEVIVPLAAPVLPMSAPVSQSNGSNGHSSNGNGSNGHAHVEVTELAAWR